MPDSLPDLEADRANWRDHIQTEADYFEGNAERMRYPQFRSRGVFVGAVWTFGRPPLLMSRAQVRKSG